MYTRNFGVESDGELFKMQQEAYKRIMDQNQPDKNRSEPGSDTRQNIEASSPHPTALIHSDDANEEALRPSKHELVEAEHGRPQKKGLFGLRLKNIFQSIKLDDILLLLLIFLLLSDDVDDELLIALALLFIFGF